MAKSFELQNTLAALLANIQKLSEESKSNLQKMSEEIKSSKDEAAKQNKQLLELTKKRIACLLYTSRCV